MDDLRQGASRSKRSSTPGNSSTRAGKRSRQHDADAILLPSQTTHAALWTSTCCFISSLTSRRSQHVYERGIMPNLSASQSNFTHQIWTSNLRQAGSGGCRQPTTLPFIDLLCCKSWHFNCQIFYAFSGIRTGSTGTTRSFLSFPAI